jgi:prepilin-type N-terminal cleavage/methylation domain-containing protein/prepilin-type processing-associated H-X9-DG protein
MKPRPIRRGNGTPPRSPCPCDAATGSAGSHDLAPSVLARSSELKWITVHRRSAFTLLELLVTVAIIAILAALLMGVLSRGGETSRRAACISNLRALHTSLSRYATDHDGMLPVGYRLAKKQFNTTLYSGSSNKWVLLGLLVEAGLVDEPRILFCPSETDSTQAFDTSANPWPRQSGKNLQGCYACNPIVDWGTAGAPPEWPRLQALGRIPLLADGAGMPARVDSRHRDGINVLFSDGSTKWVPRADFDHELKQCTELSAAANDPQTRLWEILAGTRAPR